VTAGEARPVRHWGELTAPALARAAEAGDVVLLPVGSIEQHGTHLPVDTDVNGPLEASIEIAKRRDWVVIAPPVWWGLSGAHREFPGTITLGSQTFYNLLWEICECITGQGFKLALVVGHASNRPVVGLIVSELMELRKIRVLQLNYLGFSARVFGEIRKSAIGGEAHAGELETSVQMHLRPHLVKMDPEPAVHYIDPKRDFGLSAANKDIFTQGQAVIGFDLKAQFPEGVIGDPTVASPETGAKAWDAVVEGLLGVLDEYHEL
jgi:creatinine amidohydrolase